MESSPRDHPEQCAGTQITITNFTIFSHGIEIEINWNRNRKPMGSLGNDLHMIWLMVFRHPVLKNDGLRQLG